MTTADGTCLSHMKTPYRLNVGIAIVTGMISEDDVSPATLVIRILQTSWRHALYQALDAPNDTATLASAVDRAAATAEATAAQLRRIVETLVAEGREELGSGFVYNPDISEEYLLELCDRGLLTSALGHRAGPRSLLARMCEVHRYPEAILTLGQELYRDPSVPPEEFVAFLRRYHDVSHGWLLRALAAIDPDSGLKQAAYQDMLAALPAEEGAAWSAVGFHARHLANAPTGDAEQLTRFLDRHDDAQVLALLLDSPVPDPARSELLESRAQCSADLRVADALRRRQQRRDASSPSLDAETAAALAVTEDADVLILLAANPRTPRPVLHELSTRRASHRARAIRNAATHTLRLTRQAGTHPEH